MQLLTAFLSYGIGPAQGVTDYPSGIMVPISPADVISVINAIAAAVETVQGNKEECLVIGDRVKRIRHALNQGKSNESSEALHGLHQTLKEILAFLNKFNDANYFRKFINRNTGEL